MGTIYLKADLSNVTVDNINQFNLDQLDCDEVYELLRAGHRNILLQVPTTTHVQYYIHRSERLTKEECEMIINNSSDIWDDIGQLHEYSAEFLLEHGDKLCRLNIEGQRNITPDFVSRYADRLSMGSLLQYRERFGDVLEFLVTPEMCRRYLSRHLSWRASKDSLVQAVSNCNFNEGTLQNVLQFINQWFDVPIDINKLVSDYEDRDRADYSIDVVTGYWNSNSRKQKYANWEEYVNECKDTGLDGLANTWFNSYFRQPLLEILGYND